MTDPVIIYEIPHLTLSLYLPVIYVLTLVTNVTMFYKVLSITTRRDRYFIPENTTITFITGHIAILKQKLKTKQTKNYASKLLPAL